MKNLNKRCPNQMIKNLLNKWFKSRNAPIDDSELQSTSMKADGLVPQLSFYDFVSPTGFEVPTQTRDHGYVLDGPVGSYPFRTFHVEFGTTTLTTGALDVLYRAGPINLNFFITK